MASATQTASKVDGTTKTTATYSVDTSGFGYSIITDDIKADFDFLINDLPQKLDNVMAELNNATNIDDAFYFENGNNVKDLALARDEIQKDVNNIKTELNNLYNAFMMDIDNINAELEYNFGWIIIGDVKGSQRDEVVPQETTE